jgi:hypothetical protein
MTEDLIFYMGVWFVIGLLGSIGCIAEIIFTKEK